MKSSKFFKLSNQSNLEEISNIVSNYFTEHRDFNKTRL